MKRISTIMIIFGIISLLTAVGVWAQPSMGRGGGVHYGTMWDVSSVTSTAGEVTGVEKYTPGRGGASSGLRLILQTDKETLPVILGPAWYIEQQHFVFASKDNVEVKGSRFSIQGQPALIAQEVKKGGKVLRLRDAKGVPLWSGTK